MIMNSYMISLSWIHWHEFKDDFIHMNSDIWFHNVLHNHEFISEFILRIHIRFHNHEFICDISWPMNSYIMMNSCIWRISWNHSWNHGYKGSRWSPAGARTWNQTSTLQSNQRVVKVLSALKSLGMLNDNEVRRKLERPHLNRATPATSPRNYTHVLVHWESCLQGLEIPANRTVSARADSENWDCGPHSPPEQPIQVSTRSPSSPWPCSARNGGTVSESGLPAWLTGTGTAPVNDCGMDAATASELPTLD